MQIVRTYSASRQDTARLVVPAFALTRQTKDVYNTAVYLVRQVLSSFEGGQLKAELQPAQREVLERANACVARINAARAAAPARLKKDGSPRAVKVLLPFGQGATPWQILDATLLDNVLREMPGFSPGGPYAGVPAVVAQQAGRDVAELFKAWLAALRQHTGAKGRPQMPGYLDKHARRLVSLPAAALPKTGLPGLGQRPMFLDYQQTEPLPAEARDAWGGWPAAEVVARARAQHKLPPDAQLLELRLVPKPRQRTQLDLVFGWEVALQPDCPLARCAGLKPDEQLVQLASFKPDQITRVAGGDLGLNNLLTLAFGNGSPGQVVSNRRFERRLAVLDARLDAALAAAVGPELRALRSRRDTERLSSADMVKLRQLEAAIEALPLIDRMRQERRYFVKNFMHQVSQGVVARLAREHVNVLVLGQNKGWKNGAQGSDKGRAFNRRNLRVGHAQLLEQLRYKCEAAGILLVTTEESYTSKTSFALNEPLRTYPRAPETLSSSTGSAESPDLQPGAEPSETRTPPLGRRQRHVFKSPGAIGPWASLHADLNGAYNILRKVFLHFQWHAALSARFTLLWLSPKKGLTEFAQRSDIPFRGRAGALPVL